MILHYETPSPFTPLGAKGVGEGNCMSTPVCIANAVADALGLAEVAAAAAAGALAEHLHGAERAAGEPSRAQPQSPASASSSAKAALPSMLLASASGTGCSTRNARRDRARRPQHRENLRHRVPRRGDARRRPGEGPLPRRDQLSDMHPPHAVTLDRHRRGRARLRPRPRPGDAAGGGGHDDLSVQLRGRDRRQGRLGRRAAAGRRGESHHRPVLRRTRRPGRRRAATRPVRAPSPLCGARR